MNPYQCEIQTRPTQPTVCRRTTAAAADLPQVLGESYGMIMGHLSVYGQQPVGAPYVAYFNMDMQALKLEVGFPVAKALPPAGQVEAGEIPEGKYACVMHNGSYQSLGSAYSAINEYIANQGLEATGVVYEIYLNDPSISPEDQLQTQILFQLK